MDVQAQSAPRYRARAERRPVLYWWQAFFLLGVVALLWSQLPMTAVLYDARGAAPLPEPRAAYVALDPAYAAQAFKKSLTAWTLGGGGDRSTPGLELGGIDMASALRAPEFLEQGAVFPGVWRPAAVRPLDQPLPEVRVPSQAEAGGVRRVPETGAGVRVSLSPSLEAAGFAFPLKPDVQPDRGGQCRFYVEVGADGGVEHVLLMSARSAGAAALERALLKGRADGAARGFVDLYWSAPKP
jgi:hypothetical protein